MAFRIRIIKDKGKKQFENLRFRMSSELELDVGIDARQGTRQHPSRSGLTIAEVGAIHELGLAEPRIPKRSFLAAWFNTNQTLIRTELRFLGRVSFLGRVPLKKAAALVGKDFQRQIQDQFGSIPPANQPSTVLRKGHGLTLIDTETLRDSISATVRVKRGRS